MKETKNRLLEHLITKRKYNKLQIKLDLKSEEYDKKVVELNQERRIHKIQKEIWERNLQTQEQEIIDLKTEIKELKKRKRVNSKNEK